jgi:membrane-associated protein
MSIVLGRFMPIIRTFVPFLAGVGKMKYWKFFLYNVVGAFLWVGLFTLGGYYFGGLKFVQDHFTLVLLLIIGVSFIPAIWQLAKYLMDKTKHRKVKN